MLLETVAVVVVVEETAGNFIYTVNTYYIQVVTYLYDTTEVRETTTATLAGTTETTERGSVDNYIPIYLLQSFIYVTLLLLELFYNSLGYVYLTLFPNI